MFSYMYRVLAPFSSGPASFELFFSRVKSVRIGSDSHRLSRVLSNVGPFDRSKISTRQDTTGLGAKRADFLVADFLI